MNLLDNYNNRGHTLKDILLSLKEWIEGIPLRAVIRNTSRKSDNLYRKIDFLFLNNLKCSHGFLSVNHFWIPEKIAD